jgi:hypothetical protein
MIDGTLIVSAPIGDEHRRAIFGHKPGGEGTSAPKKMAA